MGMVQWLASHQEKGLRTRAKQQMRGLGSAWAGRTNFFPEPRGMKVQVDYGLCFSVNGGTEEWYPAIVTQVKLSTSS